MDGLVCGPLFQETFTRGRSEYNQLRPSYIPDGIVLFIIDRTKRIQRTPERHEPMGLENPMTASVVAQLSFVCAAVGLLLYSSLVAVPRALPVEIADGFSERRGMFGDRGKGDATGRSMMTTMMMTTMMINRTLTRSHTR